MDASANTPMSLCRLDGKGKASSITSERLSSATSETPVWIHLNRGFEETAEWLNKESGLDPFVVDALLAEETRPRTFAHEKGLVVILRGVNLNPGATPDDMVSIRLWIESHRVITVRNRRVMALSDVKKQLDRGDGPTGTGEFLVQLINGISERIADVVENLDELTDQLDEELLNHETPTLRSNISNVRRQIIRLRRYIAPQREVILRLQTEKADWLDSADRSFLRELADSMTRYVEDLDLAKERISITYDELESHMNAQINRTMFLLSIVTVIFLPLGLITGLLGINVAGIPGKDNPNAFAVVCGCLLLLACFQVFLFYRIRWIRLKR